MSDSVRKIRRNRMSCRKTKAVCTSLLHISFFNNNNRFVVKQMTDKLEILFKIAENDKIYLPCIFDVKKQRSFLYKILSLSLREEHLRMK